MTATLRRAAWIFYAIALAATLALLDGLWRLTQPTPFDLGRFQWVRVAEMAVIAALALATAQGLRQERAWAIWLGFIQAGILLLIFPVGTIGGLLIGGYLLWANRKGPAMPKALLLPAIFLLIVAPLALFVASGAGTHMSPLMLYPFAAPWWLFFPDDLPGSEIPGLLAGCALNAVLLTLAGWYLDRRKVGSRSS